VRRHLALLAVATFVAGCGSGQESHLDTSAGAWSVSDQADFVGACDASVRDGTDPGYCQCALEAAEAVEPHPVGSVRDAGVEAGQNARGQGGGKC
jgi:hypothetical protein